ncbi:MAG: hypothetical protein J6U01_01165 [Clostridia bacterium]|nr:hypothetical protein [Clostridia bacterium]
MIRENAMNQKQVIAGLAEEYPLLYLNPDKDDQETYRRVVLRGEEPDRKDLSHYTGDPADRMETARTPAGEVRIATLGNRQDFERVIRGLMAAKDGPLRPVPPSQGAAMLTVFNWPRIHAHLAAYPEEEQAREFQKFISVKENYTDSLIVMSRGPYSHVSADALGLTEERWLELSDIIRRYHEMTHFICRKQYPGNIRKIRDELIADTVGLYAAYGFFDPETEKAFLGIRGETYCDGRLGNYTEEPQQAAPAVCRALTRLRQTVERAKGCAPFELIPPLMDADILPEDGAPEGQ